VCAGGRRSRYLDDVAESGLSVERPAASVGCATDTLSRQFHRERGVTLMTWITKERVALAKELLADARYNVAEVL
jgi:transcriptional regulator GlxA family with amidase domain